jgi:hypothetical protein
MGKRRKWLSAAAITALAVAGAGTWAIAQPATAASAPGWRITQSYNVNSLVPDISAASAGNAWMCADQLIMHWNGAKWRKVATPAVVIAHGAEFIAAVPRVPSAWVFGYHVDPVTAATRAYAVRWTGRGWAKPVLFAKNTRIDAVAAPAANAVWAFINGRTAERFNGTTWKPAPSPRVAVLHASALSPTDIWVAGIVPGTAGGPGTDDVAIAHWNGKAWSRPTVPAIPVGKGGWAWPQQIIADTPRDVWAIASTVGVGPGLAVLHWDGKKWSLVPSPARVAPFRAAASDGKGGFWMYGANFPGNGEQDYLFHDANGTWTGQPVPVPAGAAYTTIGALAAIGRTSSLWAVGNVTYGTPPAKTTTKTVILKYGI